MSSDARSCGDHSSNAGDQPPEGRVKINVGGSVFETSLSTLTRFDDSMFTALVAGRWQRQDELFIDRNPTHFGKMLQFSVCPVDSIVEFLEVLDYLRDGKYVVLPKDDYSSECLQREAEFYNLPGLVELCFSKRSANHPEKLDNSSQRTSRVKINVGGTVFETLLSTLTKKDSVFSAMLANRQRQEELFFDRESELFPMVMDYLRYGKISAVPVDRNFQAKLRREAEFYNLPGLLKCMFKTFDKVQLVESAVEGYCLLDVEKSYNGRTVNQCTICGFTVHPAYHPSYLMTTYIGIEKGVVNVTYGVSLGQTLPMSEIKSTTGSVSRIDSTCCFVEWNDHQATHLPKTALRLTEIR